jgi:hypothetical protein
MSLVLHRCLAGLLGIVMVTILEACVVGGGGYEGGGVEASYGVDFYEPYGYDYGGWGPGYRVGPPHGGEGRPDHYRAGSAPAYRPAGPSRSMPSIPTRSRGR